MLSHKRRSSKKSCFFGFFYQSFLRIYLPVSPRHMIHLPYSYTKSESKESSDYLLSVEEFSLQCEIWGSYSGLDDDSSFLGYDTLTYGK